MNNYRKTAIVVGLLFITATVTNVVGNLLFSNPVLEAPDYLVSASAHANQVATGALLELIAAFACAGIAIGLYPVLRKHNEGMALGSVGLRVIEGIFYCVAVLPLLSVLTLSQEYAAGTSASAAFYQASGSSLLAIRDWAGQLGVIAFTLGALMYYSLFYRSKLIPRWLSGWGFLAAAFSLASALLSLFGQVVPLSPVSLVLNLPIGVQEMVLAGWLIVKGFTPSAIAAGSLSAKPATGELVSVS